MQLTIILCKNIKYDKLEVGSSNNQTAFMYAQFYSRAYAYFMSFFGCKKKLYWTGVFCMYIHTNILRVYVDHLMCVYNVYDGEWNACLVHVIPITTRQTFACNTYAGKPATLSAQYIIICWCCWVCVRRSMYVVSRLQQPGSHCCNLLISMCAYAYVYCRFLTCYCKAV